MTVNQWSIDTQPVKTAALSGGGGDAPFLKLIEEGDFYSDMKDYFYYSQIRSKGEQTTETRVLDGSIPLSELNNMMCALGYFPTQMEVENMMNEIKYSKFEETGELTLKIKFEDFVKLYVNHRPVFPIESQDVQKAFANVF